MAKRFINRKKELDLLDKEIKKSKLIVIYGRRRIGKTRLITEWGKNNPIVYSQAIEGAENLQIEQFFSDIKEILPTNIEPSSWTDFFELLSLVKRKVIIVIDEFPYLVKSNNSLPSIIQKWIDHKQPENVNLIILGSSQTMMHSIFLDSSSPLYQRAGRIIQIGPMGYKTFCEYSDIDLNRMDSFIKYSIVGGIPKYWELINGKKNYLNLIDEIFFSEFPLIENEPYRLLKDENINGLQPISILEAIGRGATKLSEIAKSIKVAQTSLGRPLQLLMDTSIISRELPFGESIRSTKKTLYYISDYLIRFWYSIYSPHRSRWHLYSKEKKNTILLYHTSFILEYEYRKLFMDSSRYWEDQIAEFDCVRYADDSLKKIIISEIKWKKQNTRYKELCLIDMSNKYKQTKLCKKYDKADFEVLTFDDVVRLIK